MEDIIRKDIFKDKDLFKLSPDFHPSDVVLRMQTRRNLVKDTHRHNSHIVESINNVESNRIQNTSKEIHNINREIVKLKHSYTKRNSKNEIILKNRACNIGFNKAKQKSNYNNVNEVLSTSRVNTDCIQISSEFNNILQLNVSANNLNSTHEKIKNKEINNIDVDYKEDNLNIVNNMTNNETPRDTNIYDDEKDLNISELVLENSIKPVDDLQSILIMMALSSHEQDEIAQNTVEHIETDNNNKENKNFVLVSSSIQQENELNFLYVTPLKSESAKRQHYLLTKYIAKWKSYIQSKQETLAKLRKNALNHFFDQLEKRKTCQSGDRLRNEQAKSSVRDYNTYHHRYKVQKHIIALQRAKLDEQNRLIEELKYNKIIEATKHSVDAMKEEVRKTYFEIDRHLKPKIKCLTNELKLHEIEEPSLVLHCLKVPQFLQRMEKRAREREEKHAVIRERRRQMEEERVKLKQQAELAKAEMDKEEKLKRIKELRDRRKREKIENIRKKQHAERMRALKVMADLHYERNLMSRCGLKPWMKLIQIKRDNVEKAKAHYRFQLLKNVFLHWMWHTEDMWYDRNYRADDFLRKKYLRWGFDCFKDNHHNYVLKKQVAEDYYDFCLMQLAFRKLREGIDVIRKENEIKLLQANVYYNSNLMFKVFTLWRTLPALNALKREQEARKMKWRQKVLQVVPDYLPPDD